MTTFSPWNLRLLPAHTPCLFCSRAQAHCLCTRRASFAPKLRLIHCLCTRITSNVQPFHVPNSQRVQESCAHHSIWCIFSKQLAHSRILCTSLCLCTYASSEVMNFDVSIVCALTYLSDLSMHQCTYASSAPLRIITSNLSMHLRI